MHASLASHTPQSKERGSVVRETSLMPIYIRDAVDARRRGWQLTKLQATDATCIVTAIDARNSGVPKFEEVSQSRVQSFKVSAAPVH